MLLFAGCSHTKGIGLKDQEKERYSTLMGQRLSKDVLNVAKQGGSNDEIARRTVDGIVKNNPEFVFVQFTSCVRTTLWYQNDWRNLNTGQINQKCPLQPFARTWYEMFYTDELGSLNLWKNVLFLENFIEQRKIPYYFFIINNCHRTSNIYKEATKWNNMISDEDILGHRLRDPKNPNLRNRGRHPTAEEHSVFADKLLDIYKSM